MVLPYLKKSKRTVPIGYTRVSVSLDGDDSDENDIVKKLYLRCEECGSITEVVFEKLDEDNPKYIKGKIIE